MVNIFKGLIASFVLVALPALTSACATHYGARGVAPSGFSYNKAIAQSKDEQLLLNLVRLRYRDTVVFMDIGGVTTQQQYVAGLSAETLLPFTNLSTGSVNAIPNGQYSETPTISYVPLKGTGFAKKLLSPIAPDTIVLLANSGWSVERLLSCCVERLGTLSNAPSASGPTPQALPNNADYRRAAKLLRELQSEERVFVEHLPSDSGELETFLVIEAPEGADCQTLRGLLNTMSCQMRFRLVEHHGGSEEGILHAQTRTVLGALYTVSHGVSVPDEHRRSGLVTTSQPQSAETNDWDTFLGGQFHVYVSDAEPSQAFVKIRYRDFWFWIDDSDLQTKTTFNLLTFLMSLQTAASDGATPLLTLSAG